MVLVALIGRVRLTGAAANRPTSVWVAVDGGRGSVLAVGEGLRGLAEFHRPAIGGQRELAEEEIAERALIIDAPRPVFRQAVVRQHFQSNRRDAFEIGVESQIVDIALALVAAGQDRVVIENGEERQITFGSNWPEHGPVYGFGRLLP